MRYDGDGFCDLDTLVDIDEKRAEDSPPDNVSRRVLARLRYHRDRQRLNVCWEVWAGTGRLWHSPARGSEDVDTAAQAKSLVEQRVTEALAEMSKRLLAGERA